MAEPVMVDIECIRGPGDREAPDISDSLITNETIGRARGKAFIDDQWYVRRIIKVSVPFIDGLYRDRQIVRLNSPAVGIVNHICFVRSIKGVIRIQGKDASLMYDLELESYTDPPLGYGS